jgi:hypothetical protein
MSIILRYLASTLFIVSACTGCGGQSQMPKDRASVSGAVTYQGKPLPAGRLTFDSVEGSVATPVSITDGRYSTPRAPIGKCDVTVDTTSIQAGNPAKYVKIPEKYLYPGESGLTAEIKEGENENVDFNLE